MRRKTVVAPKVVMQTSRRQQVLWTVLLVAGFLLAIWYSYDYGRRQAQTGTPVEIGQDRESAQHITALEEERKGLKTRVAELEKANQTRQQALETARARIRALEEAGAAQGGTPEVEQPAPVPQADDNGLQLSAVHIERTDSADRFRYSFSVLYTGADSDLVTGNIWIAVNGLSNGEPKRLQLNSVSANSRPYLKMSFKGQQDVEGEVMLPAAFIPRNITIEAKPFDKRYREATGKFDWMAGG